jgi:sugar transferase (PEP-CTERM/EpsH1 system associated)
MRKLLFLSHRMPYPPDKGDKIRSFHILKHLASRFEIHLGCFYDEPEDKSYVDLVRAYCSEVFALPISPRDRLGRSLRALISGQSISRRICFDAGMASWVNRTLVQNRIADIFVFCSSMTPYVQHHMDGRHVVFDFVDVDSAKWGAYATSTLPPLGWLFRLEQRRVLALEANSASVCDRVLLVSEPEAELFRSLCPTSAPQVLGNGVDAETFDPGGNHPDPFDAESLPIIFTGAMDYRANIDAVIWFAQNVFPMIRATHNRAEFWIVGSKPSRAVRGLEGQEGIHVTGRVKDVRPYLHHAACVVAPLRIARGVQNKVLEAMAMAKPVVATPEALEGIRAEPRKHVLTAGSSQDFARCVLEVLSGKWSCLGPVARERVMREHSWDESLRGLDSLFSPATGLKQQTAKLSPISAGLP